MTVPNSFVPPTTVLLSYLYFLQGVPYGLQARFLPIYFRAHGMSLSNIGFIKILFFPWMCKTLWAPFVDHFGNKKTWLLWSMLGLGATCVLTAGIEPSWLSPLCVILLIFNFLTSTQDIATDGLAIEMLTSSQVASGNIAQVVGYKFGAIIGGGLLAWLSDHISWSAIFIFLTMIYAMAVFVVKFHVPESGHASTELTIEVSEPTLSGQHSFKESYEHFTGGNHSGDTKTRVDSPSKNTRSKSKHATQSTAGVQSTDSKSSMTRQDFTEKYCEPEGDHMPCHTDSSGDTSKVSAGSRQESGPRWILDHFRTVLQAEGTVWILVYVLVYKLGEQGALNMMPMFLIDHGVPTADVGLWTGLVGLAVSIGGSIVGGAVISSDRYTALNFLSLLSVLKVVVLALETVAVGTWSEPSGSLGFGTVPCIFLMLVLLVVSGAVSTAAFTLMMQCSQRASPQCRASHYSLLATAEVLGKLMFSVFVGAITDAVGYTVAFGLFLTLSVIVLPLFRYAPPSLMKVSKPNLNGCNKNG
ncbi:major facilitator superfamily domain-containing protein 3-like [Littorina saxatilis]|uniref:major facilitator superfamily domain-containing protein 3-like n=1 Tax=Littorina saxatilis TaxID=31220 RepID=UPI0038B53AC6